MPAWPHDPINTHIIPMVYQSWSTTGPPLSLTSLLSTTIMIPANAKTMDRYSNERITSFRKRRERIDVQKTFVYCINSEMVIGTIVNANLTPICVDTDRALCERSTLRY